MAAAIGDWQEKARRFIDRDLWQADRGGVAGMAQRVLQVVVIVVQGVQRDQVMMRASGLTYFAMLSLIPLIAVALTLVGAFTNTEEVATFLVERITVAVPEVRQYLMPLVAQIDLTGLGIFGATTLLMTTVLALSNVERALNAIWGVEQERSWARRFPDYLAVLVVAPLMLSLALSMRTTFASESLVTQLLELPGFAEAYRFGLKQAPAVLTFLAFGFLYWFLPNTRVRPLPALLGGIIAAVLFGVAQLAFISFAVGSAKASAFFGGFAALPLLLLWLYFSWAIVLLGAEVAFAVQNLPTFRQARQGEDPRPGAREALGLSVAARVARAFRDGGEPITAEHLADHLDAPVRSVRGILAELEAGRIVAPRGEVDTYQLGRAADHVTAGEVLEALRGPDEVPIADPVVGPEVEALLRDLSGARREALGARTLADLAGPRSVDPPESTG